MSTPLLWALFNLFILAMLALDLGIAARRNRPLTLPEALGWSAFWVSLAVLFGVGVYFWRGGEAALQFATGFIIEESLSVDNLFVFLMLFSYFKVPPVHQHRVLFWGILGAIVFRTIFIFVGVALIERFHWILYVFGAFLVYTGWKMATKKEEEIDPDKNPVLKWIRSWLPVTPTYHGKAFFVRQEGRLFATPLFIVLLTVEMTDVIFAVDSIPAVLAISSDPFIIYTSNVFAILGLRSLFFALSGMMGLFHLLNYGLSVILIFVGTKMLISSFYTIPIGVSLGVVVATLAISIIASRFVAPPDSSE